jgi:hypothetical protein
MVIFAFQKNYYPCEVLCSSWFLKELFELIKLILWRSDASHGAGHANHTCGNGAEFAQEPLSLPSGPITSGAEFGQDPLSLSSGPITRLRAKRFKEALNGLIQENGVDSKKTKMGPNNDQGLVHVIKAIDEVN